MLPKLLEQIKINLENENLEGYLSYEKAALLNELNTINSLIVPGALDQGLLMIAPTPGFCPACGKPLT